MNTQTIFDNEIPPQWSGIGNPEAMSVGIWFGILISHYRSKSEVEGSMVTRLEWFKCREGLRHEYIVATVERTGKSKTYLQIERNSSYVLAGEDEEFVNPLTSDERTFLLQDLRQGRKSCGSIFWESMQSSIKSNTLASDTVVHLPNSTEHVLSKASSTRLIATYREFQPPLTLRDLAFIAKVIHDRQITYHVFVNQCYWFSAVLMDTIRQRHTPKFTYGRAYHAAGHYRRFIPVITKESIRGGAERVQLELNILLQESDKHIHEVELIAERAARTEDAEAELSRANEEASKAREEVIKTQMGAKTTQEEARIAVELANQKAEDALAKLEQLKKKFENFMDEFDA